MDRPYSTDDCARLETGLPAPVDSQKKEAAESGDLLVMTRAARRAFATGRAYLVPVRQPAPAYSVRATSL